MPEHDRDLVDRFLIGVAIIGLSVGVMAMLGAGLSFSVAGVRISVRTSLRPVTVAVLAGIVALGRSEVRRRQLGTLWESARRHATRVAVCMAIFVFVIAMRMSLFEVRASDQYGYVSQALLWAQGHLATYQPLAAIAPWPDATWTLSPLGYCPAQQPSTIVPTYPAGLPLVMAAFIRLFGPFGPFLVVPLMGSFTVLLTFFLGRRVGGEVCGLFAAMLIATSPIFLYQLTQPMSDVPVTVWWLLAILLLIEPGAASAAAGGLAASAAILTRPNLVPLAVPLGLFVLAYSHPQFGTRLRNTMLYGAGALPGCIAVAVLNRTLYGSPFASGYGSSEFLFKIENLGANLSTYPRWLIETETPFVLLAFVAPWLIRSPLRRMFAAMAATTFVCYVFYLPFDNWTYLRFLLPAIPLMLILSSAVTLHLARRLSPRSAVWLAGACVVLMAWRWDTLGLQPPRPDDRRFAVVGEFVRDQLPQNAILISMQHSGSVRYYSGRSTLRWDWMPAEWLERSLAFLRANGYRPFLLLEEWERPLFAQRFAAHTKLAALDWQPVATYSGEIRTDIFDPADHDQPGASAAIKTIGTVPPMSKAR